MASSLYALSAWVVVLASIWFRLGPAMLFSVVAFGALPVLIILIWHGDVLEPLTGLVDKRKIEVERRNIRRQEKEQFRNLVAVNGGESMEWLNFIIERMWPHVAKYAEELIVSFEERIQNCVHLPGIRFAKCSLGSEPIRFGPITPRIAPAYYDDKFQLEGGVELIVGLTYHSDCEIMLSAPIASIGVAALDITGDLCVLLRPLHGKSPFVGGIEVLFNNPPKVEVDFRGIGNLADMPGIYGTVRRLIDDAIAGFMVTPNRIAKQISVDPRIDLARLKNPLPEGVLRITVFKAQNLEGMDLNFLGKKTSDPYVQIKIGQYCWKTPTVMKTCNPEWTMDNVQDFVVYSVEQHAQIDIFDWDRIGSDDPLGSINRIPIRKLMLWSGRGVNSWPLEAGSETEDAPPDNACLHFSVEWLCMSHPLQGRSIDGPNRYSIMLKVDSCTDIPESKESPFTVRFSLKGTSLSKESKAGWGEWSNTASLRTLVNIRKLHGHRCSSEMIADVVDVDRELIAQFIEELGQNRDYDTDSIENSERDQDWLAKMQASRQLREQNLNPQFEEVLLVLSPDANTTAMVELLGHQGKPAKVGTGKVIAHFEVPLGSHEIVNGPFQLLDPETHEPLGSAELHGSFTLCRLEHTTTRTSKWGAFSDLMGTKKSQSAQSSDFPSAAAQLNRKGAFASRISQTFKWCNKSSGNPFFDEVANVLSRTASTVVTSVPGITVGRTRVEEAVDLIETRNGKDVIFGLGMLRSARDWEQARHVYGRKYGGRFGRPTGKGGGDLISALETELKTNEELNNAAVMLKAHGIGAGIWPPPGSRSGWLDDVAQRCLSRRCM